MSEFRLRRVPGEGTLEDAFVVRREVFIREQDVTEDEEMDGRDEDAVHFVAYDGAGEPVGTARLREPEDGVAKPERVAVLDSYRGRGIGRRLMDTIETEARERGCSRAVLHAQTAVEEFYEDLGYRTVSDEFEEAGIPHVEMAKDLD